MCGIAGYFCPSGECVPSEEILSAMCSVIHHRGPDSGGMLCRDGMALGMRRLKIVDLSTGDQPIHNADRSVAVTFNGEIYNHRELRVELESRGHHFATQSDTEVLVHLYDEMGPEMLGELNGMFSFALADFRRQRLLLARDRLGIKPLFLAHINGTWVWGSEIKSLLQFPGMPREVDEEVLPDYLYLNYCPSGKTLFRGIEQILPGEYRILEPQGETRHSYWSLDFTPDPDMTEARAIERSQELLEDSVRMRLMSDVPFGAFLSGGIDSSAVVAYMSRHMQEPVKTFSIGFHEKSFDELPYARQVAQRYHTEHHERIVDDRVEEILPLLVWHSEEPTADSSSIAMFHVSRLAREHVTMVLSGDGGDELFAGYETYKAEHVRRMYRKIPAFLRRGLIAPAVNRLPARSGKISFEFKAKRFVKGAELSFEQSHFFWRSIFHEDLQRELLVHPPEHSTFERNREYFDGPGCNDPLSQMLHMDTRFYLPSDMLIKVDRTSMAHSLEARVPFLDHRLVEFAASVPSAVKFKGREGKHLLKKGLEPMLDHEILYRKKEGFNVPVNQWLRKGLRPVMEDLLSRTRLEKHGLFDSAFVHRLMNEHLRSRRDHSFQLWSLIVFQLWHQQFIESIPTAESRPSRPGEAG